MHMPSAGLQSCNPASPGSRVVDFAKQNQFLAIFDDRWSAKIGKPQLRKVAAATFQKYIVSHTAQGINGVQPGSLPRGSPSEDNANRRGEQERQQDRACGQLEVEPDPYGEQHR